MDEAHKREKGTCVTQSRTGEQRKGLTEKNNWLSRTRQETEHNCNLGIKEGSDREERPAGRNTTRRKTLRIPVTLKTGRTRESFKQNHSLIAFDLHFALLLFKMQILKNRRTGLVRKQIQALVMIQVRAEMYRI